MLSIAPGRRRKPASVKTEEISLLLVEEAKMRINMVRPVERSMDVTWCRVQKNRSPSVAVLPIKNQIC